ncbi:adenylate/guanylate cyclase domain-containing protein [Nocardioides coralli]|uniref:adenylate/guanylate cyclase domain-containing protein n=1 Tax=Nocardioides coralli TaxID=2872154 RepID=UPI001CA3E277|nr:adenylate/guanylate cyclase domain-containing protein [Nocardioides coralli]QZY29261.1 adenylate/guanylate cyclase domain-containing protein [Nocardioides coralli]
MGTEDEQPEADGLDPGDLEHHLLGARRTLTRVQVADKAGVPLELAEELWGQLGFPHTDDDDVAFTRHDVKALKRTAELVSLGILEPDSQAALVRTWGRSFARLAEWQVSLLAGIALSDDEPEQRLDELLGSVLPNVGKLQDYVWRRHLVSAAQRLLPQADGATQSRQAVCFTDIVGYTSQSKNLTESELVDLVERFEDEVTRRVVDVGGRVIKTIGDEVLFVTDEPRATVDVALSLTERGEDGDDDFPRVRAGVAFGDVTSRLGDVFGPTVNIASRLTSIARPGAVLVDRGAFDALTGHDEPPDTAPDGTPLARLIDRAADELAELSPYAERGDLKFRRLRRQSVKGYRHLEPWLVRRRQWQEGDRPE